MTLAIACPTPAGIVLAADSFLTRGGVHDGLGYKLFQLQDRVGMVFAGQSRSNTDDRPMADIVANCLGGMAGQSMQYIADAFATLRRDNTFLIAGVDGTAYRIHAVFVSPNDSASNVVIPRPQGQTFWYAGDDAVASKLQPKTNCSAFTLQDGIDFCTRVIRWTEAHQKRKKLLVTVGGPIDIATITVEHGFQWISRKPHPLGASPASLPDGQRRTTADGSSS